MRVHLGSDGDPNHTFKKRGGHPESRDGGEGSPEPERQAKWKRRHLTPVIDIEIIQSWRRECRTFHGGCCNERYSSALSQYIDEITLIDVTLGCLVTLPSTTPYIALSYVWGSVPVLKTTKANLHELKRDGALFGNFGALQIPNTVRDAIHLVRRLEERYLWVDCLCIVQDAGDEELDKMLRAMGRIYASAEFTIAAAMGDDANYGLRGVGGPSQVRSLDFESTEFRSYWPQDLLESYGFAKHSTWVRRGWTFQESLFSRRLLIFHDVVSWLCGRVVQHECFEDVVPYDKNAVIDDVIWPAERPHLGIPIGMMSLIPKLPSLGRWGMLVQHYSARKLTYEEDAVRAFAGATEIMGSTFPGGLLHGLPVFFFDIAMLWQPGANTARRNDQPSWSWTGWKGGVECWKWWYPHYAGIYRNTGESSDWIAMAPLKALAVYEVPVSAGQTESAVPELNAFYRFQALRNRREVFLPSGWERHEHEKGHYYTTAMGDGSHYRYGFPLPSAAVSRARPSTNLPQTLLCTAPSVTAHFEAPSKRYRSGKLFELIVQSKDAKAHYCFPASEMVNISKGSQCQLIALSEAEIAVKERLNSWFYKNLSGDLDRFSSPECIDEGGSYYNVLWIDWKDDVAYRKALGFISKKEFDALGAEVTTIQLG